ncbi:unnamed protein product, partial [Amoebophrya sp. A120]
CCEEQEDLEHALQDLVKARRQSSFLLNTSIARPDWLAAVVQEHKRNSVGGVARESAVFPPDVLTTNAPARSSSSVSAGDAGAPLSPVASSSRDRLGRDADDAGTSSLLTPQQEPTSPAAPASAPGVTEAEKQRLREDVRKLKGELEHEVEHVGTVLQSEFSDITTKLVTGVQKMGEELEKDEDVQNLAAQADHAVHRVKDAIGSTFENFDDTAVGRRFKLGGDRLMQTLQQFNNAGEAAAQGPEHLQGDQQSVAPQDPEAAALASQNAALAGELGSKLSAEVESLGKGLLEREEVWKSKGLDILASVQQRFLRRNPDWLENTRAKILQVLQQQGDEIDSLASTLDEHTSDALSSGKPPLSIRETLARTCENWVQTFATEEQTSLELLEQWENKAQNLDYLDKLDLGSVLSKAGIKLPPGLQKLLPKATISSSPRGSPDHLTGTKGSKSRRNKRGAGSSSASKSKSGKRSANDDDEAAASSSLFQSKTLASLDVSASDFTRDPVNTISKILANDRVAAKAETAMEKVDGILKQVNAASQGSAIQGLLNSALNLSSSPPKNVAQNKQLQNYHDGTTTASDSGHSAPEGGQHPQQPQQDGAEGGGTQSATVSTQILSKLENLDVGRVFDKAEDTIDKLMDGDKRDQFLNEILDAAVDLLMSFLPNIRIAELGGESEDLVYELENLDLAGFKLKKECVKLELNTTPGDPRLLNFELWDMSCQIQDLRFKYKQKKFPFLRGHGLAFAFAGDVSLQLCFSVRWVKTTTAENEEQRTTTADAGKADCSGGQVAVPRRSRRRGRRQRQGRRREGNGEVEDFDSEDSSNRSLADENNSDLLTSEDDEAAALDEDDDSSSIFSTTSSHQSRGNNRYQYDQTSDTDNEAHQNSGWRPELVMSKNEMRIGELKLHVEETRFAWLYNILSKLFGSLIQTIVVAKIQEQLAAHVSQFSEMLSVVLSHEMVRPFVESLRPENVGVMSHETVGEGVAIAHVDGEERTNG